MLSTFIFFRAEGWYPIEIPADQLQANIDCNPGTLRVEDIQGNVLWSQDARGEDQPAADTLGGPASALGAGSRPPASQKDGTFSRPDGPLQPHELQVLAFLRDEPHRFDPNHESALAAAIVFSDLSSLGLIAIDPDEDGSVMTLLPAGEAALRATPTPGGSDA